MSTQQHPLILFVQIVYDVPLLLHSFVRQPFTLMHRGVEDREVHMEEERGIWPPTLLSPLLDMLSTLLTRVVFESLVP